MRPSKKVTVLHSLGKSPNPSNVLVASSRFLPCTASELVPAVHGLWWDQTYIIVVSMFFSIPLISNPQYATNKYRIITM